MKNDLDCQYKLGGKDQFLQLEDNNETVIF